MKPSRAGWLLAAPALIVIAVFFVVPVAAALLMSATDFDIYALASLRNVRFIGQLPSGNASRAAAVTRARAAEVDGTLGGDAASRAAAGKPRARVGGDRGTALPGFRPAVLLRES